jgi:hypothetical protein
VLAVPGGVPDLALVLVELRYTDRLADSWIEVRRKLGESRVSRRLDGEGGDLLAREQPFPAQDVDRHDPSLPVSPTVVTSRYRGAPERG